MQKEMSVTAIEGLSCGPKSLKSCVVPFPTPKEDEVVIKICYVHLNNIDIEHTNELPPIWGSRPNPPVIPGIECSGTIIDVGKDVDEWKVGDKVCALLDGGGYADAVAVRATQVLPIPNIPSITMLQAACLPEAACTTWEALFRIANLSPNMTLLVYERCGKVCELAVQLAKLVQARVIVARDNRSLVINTFSPDLTVHTYSPCFTSDVRRAISGRDEGVDVVLDCVDSSIYENGRLLRSGGQLVIIKSTTFDTYGAVNLKMLSTYNASLQVVDRMGWKPEYLASVVLEMKREMWATFNNGDLQLPSMNPTCYPLRNAFDAHKYLVCCGLHPLLRYPQGFVFKP